MGTEVSDRVRRYHQEGNVQALPQHRSYPRELHSGHQVSRNSRKPRTVRTSCSFRRWQTCGNLGLRQVNQRVLSVTQGDSSQSQCRSESEWNAEPGDTAEKESLDGRCGLGCDGSLVVCLIVEDGSEVSGRGRNHDQSFWKMPSSSQTTYPTMLITPKIRPFLLLMVR